MWNTQRVIITGCSMEAPIRSTQIVTRYCGFHFTLPSHKGFPGFPNFFEASRRRGMSRARAPALRSPTRLSPSDSPEPWQGQLQDRSLPITSRLVPRLIVTPHELRTLKSGARHSREIGDLLSFVLGFLSKAESPRDQQYFYATLMIDGTLMVLC